MCLNHCGDRKAWVRGRLVSTPMSVPTAARRAGVDPRRTRRAERGQAQCYAHRNVIQRVSASRVVAPPTLFSLFLQMTFRLPSSADPRHPDRPAATTNQQQPTVSPAEPSLRAPLVSQGRLLQEALLDPYPGGLASRGPVLPDSTCSLHPQLLTVRPVGPRPVSECVTRAPGYA